MDLDPPAGVRGVGGVADSTAPPAPASAATSSALAAAPARWSTEIKVYARRYPRRKLKPPPYPDPSPPPDALTLARAPPLPPATVLAPVEPVASPALPAVELAAPPGVSETSPAASPSIPLPSPSPKGALPSSHRASPKVAPTSQDTPQVVQAPLPTPSPPAPAPAAHSEDATAATFTRDTSLGLNRVGDGSGEAIPNGVEVRARDTVWKRKERGVLRRRFAAELQQVQVLYKRLDAAADALLARDRSTLAPARSPPLLLPAEPVETGNIRCQLSATGPGAPIPTPGAAITPGRSLAQGQPLILSVVPTVSVQREKRTPKANQYYHNSEFFLAKDRLPRTNSHGQKKSKHHKKLHSLSADAAGLAAKRRLYYDPFKKCESLLGQLMNHKFGWVFNSPVDPVKEGLPDNFQIINHPMDLGTIKERLNHGQYKNPREFAEDVRLTFHNALMYNLKGNNVNAMAEQLLVIFEEKWSEIEAQVDYLVSCPPCPKKFPPPPNDLRVLEQSDSAMHRMLLDSKTKPIHNTPPYCARTPALKKPKAKDPDKRDMTPKEREKLCKNLENLPMEKLKLIVQIFENKNFPVKHNDDGIELEISELDTDTLWALDRFVTNHKKNLSKIKRKAEVARQDVEMHAQEATLQRNQEPDGGESPKQNEMAEEQLATSLPARDGNNGGNTSRSSGSDSSESGSSSSGSDWLFLC